MNAQAAPSIRHDWSYKEVEALYSQPFSDLMFQAQLTHRQFFNPNEVQVSTLLSIKTGKCPEDCAYCPQSNRYDTGLEYEDLMEVQAVLVEAEKAKATGATRFCMGAAWRSPKDRDMAKVTAMVKGVKDLGLESCMTLGMLTDSQAGQLAEAGLDYYNHNLDTSKEFYGKIITTRTFQDRLDTLQNVRDAGMKVCSGGIVGMGESLKDRIGLLIELSSMPEHPESVPMNMLVKVEGTPLDQQEGLDPFEFLRTIAVARILMPQSHVRLSAGREQMNDQMQSLAFLAGANSIFYGDKLLTTDNPEANEDMQLFQRLGINTEEYVIDDSEETGAFAEIQKEDYGLFYNAAS
jgi:biotin synthase